MRAWSRLALAVGLVALAACSSAGSDRGSEPGSTSTTTSVGSTSVGSTSTTGAPGTTPTSTTTAPPATTTEPAAPTSASPRPDVPSPNGSLAGLTVVVDPGHNGANGAHPAEINRPVDAGGFTKPCNTTGTEGDGYPESRFNWETAQRLAAALEDRGARAVLTRTSDDGWGPCVDQRGLTAQREGAALIVSIHADGAAAGASGFHVIHAAAGPAVTAEVADRSTELATTVRDQLQAAGFEPATYLGGGTGMVARTDIATLNRAGVPGVMVECGNMRNASDLARLRSEEGQQAIAEAITAAVAQRYGAR